MALMGEERMLNDNSEYVLRRAKFMVDGGGSYLYSVVSIDQLVDKHAFPQN
jgi:hypothetical protein